MEWEPMGLRDPDQLEKKLPENIKFPEAKWMDPDLAGENTTHGSKGEQLRDLLYYMQKLRRQMKLLKNSNFPEANKNRTHCSKGEESNNAEDYYSLSTFLSDLTAIVEELGYDFDLDSIDYVSDEESEDEDLNLPPVDKCCDDEQFPELQKKLPENIKFPEIKWVDLGEESEDEDLNLPPVDKCCDDEQFLKLCQIRTNDAGVSYVRLGDYVYVKDPKNEENSDDGYSEEEGEGCPICFDLDHNNNNCPWLVNVPPGKTVGRLYDIECKGCGKLGPACCSEGGRAVLRRCGHCFDFGHWGGDCPNYKYMPLSAFPDYP